MDFVFLTREVKVPLRLCFKHLTVKPRGTGLQLYEFFSTLLGIDISVCLHISITVTLGKRPAYEFDRRP
jgi:hypothetical protein